MDNPRVVYNLVYPVGRKFIKRDYMPILCGSLVYGSCPLKRGQNITYSAFFQVDASIKLWSFLKIRHEALLLQIDVYGNENEFGSLIPIFRFEVKIKLGACLLHVFC